MSKSNKNQKSITSFFKNPAQSTSNDPSASKPKSSPLVEVKQEEILKLPSSSPPPGPAPASLPSAKAVLSPKKPTVIVSPTVTNQRQPAYDTEWINLSDRFLLTNRNFDVQYAHLYAERLGIMRKMVAKAAENHWGLFIYPINKDYFAHSRFQNTNQKNE
jgi:hypothetical protein